VHGASIGGPATDGHWVSPARAGGLAGAGAGLSVAAREGTGRPLLSPTAPTPVRLKAPPKPAARGLPKLGIQLLFMSAGFGTRMAWCARDVLGHGPHAPRARLIMIRTG
jgi:hypothetical protein